MANAIDAGAKNSSSVSSYIPSYAASSGTVKEVNTVVPSASTYAASSGSTVEEVNFDDIENNDLSADTMTRGNNNWFGYSGGSTLSDNESNVGSIGGRERLIQLIFTNKYDAENGYPINNASEDVFLNKELDFEKMDNGTYRLYVLDENGKRIKPAVGFTTQEGYDAYHGNQESEIFKISETMWGGIKVGIPTEGRTFYYEDGTLMPVPEDGVWEYETTTNTYKGIVNGMEFRIPYDAMQNSSFTIQDSSLENVGDAAVIYAEAVQEESTTQEPKENPTQPSTDTASTTTNSSRTAVSSVDVPNDLNQTGIIPNYTNYEYFYGKWNKGTTQREISEVWASRGKTSDRGIATIDDNYLVAVSPKFGKAGDQIEVVLEDGTSINCIIADVKGGDAGSEWGHSFGKSGIDIIEWQSLGKQDTIELGDWRGKDVAKIINYGSYRA